MIAVNLSLLEKIRAYGTITYSELRSIYIVPEPPGVISACNTCFDSDLHELEEEGRIKREDDTIRFIR